MAETTEGEIYHLSLRWSFKLILFFVLFCCLPQRFPQKRKQAIALASQKQPMLPGRVRIPVAHQRVVRRQSWESVSSDETVHDNIGVTTILEGGHPYFTENSRYTLTGDRACGCSADDDVKVTVKITPGEEGGLQVSPDPL